MERDDSDQEGQTLPPTLWYRSVARDEANRALRDHIGLCPLSSAKIEDRLRGLEVRFALMIGLMLGAGLLGGAAGAIVTKLLPH